MSCKRDMSFAYCSGLYGSDGHALGRIFVSLNIRSRLFTVYQSVARLGPSLPCSPPVTFCSTHN